MRAQDCIDQRLSPTIRQADLNVLLDRDAPLGEATVDHA